MPLAKYVTHGCYFIACAVRTPDVYCFLRKIVEKRSVESSLSRMERKKSDRATLCKAWQVSFLLRCYPPTPYTTLHLARRCLGLPQRTRPCKAIITRVAKVSLLFLPNEASNRLRSQTLMHGSNLRRNTRTSNAFGEDVVRVSLEKLFEKNTDNSLFTIEFV